MSAKIKKMINTIFNHRSIRNYKEDPIEENILTFALEAGSRASTTGNMQVYSMVVTRKKALREKLWEMHFKQDMVKQAPVIITFCADFNRFNKWCEQIKAVPGYNNYLSFFTAAIDALLVAQNVALAAESKGLGICYLGTTTYMAKEISTLLKLPKGVVPVTTLVLGYAEEIPELTDRLPLEAVVHRDVYHEFMPEDIDRIYTEREASNETKSLLEENQKETLAQIFTDNRYTKKDNEFFSEKFLQFIREQGFM